MKKEQKSKKQFNILDEVMTNGVERLFGNLNIKISNKPLTHEEEVARYIPKKKNGPPYFYDSETMHLVVNYYIDSMGIEDIAMLLGLSPDSVNQILDHILPHLS